MQHGGRLMQFGTRLLKAHLENSKHSGCTRVLQVAHVRFAAFSQCGQFLVAATDDCRLLIWDVEQVRAWQRAEQGSRQDMSQWEIYDMSCMKGLHREGSK
jgi:hypothetical protein